MTFDPFDDSIWVPDHQEWMEFNRKNLAARKEEWKRIQPRLKIVKKIRNMTGSYLSVHKSLFFKGLLSENQKSDIATKYSCSMQGSDELFFCFPLFYFWYHPNLTHEVVQNAFDRLTKPPLAPLYRDKISALAIRESISMYYQLQTWGGYYDEYGIMGGREEIIAPYFLLGSQTGTAENSYRTGWFGPSCGWLIVQMVPGMMVLDGKRKQPSGDPKYDGNPRGTGQYIWPQISHYIQRNFASEVACPSENNLDKKLRAIDICIQKVLYHGEYPLTQTDDPLAIACRDRILGQYRNGELAEWLSERFAQRERLGMEIL